MLKYVISRLSYLLDYLFRDAVKELNNVTVSGGFKM